MKTLNLALIAVLLFFGSSTPAGANHNQPGDVFGVFGACEEPDVENMKAALRSQDMRNWVNLVLRSDSTCVDSRVLGISSLYPVWFVRLHSRECIKGKDVEFLVFKDSKGDEAVTWETMGACPIEQSA